VLFQIADEDDIVRTEDGYIIQQCLDGDTAAFGLLVDKYRKSVYALAYSKVGISTMLRTSPKRCLSRSIGICAL
jgi:hypothetical protein